MLSSSGAGGLETVHHLSHLAEAVGLPAARVDAPEPVLLQQHL